MSAEPYRANDPAQLKKRRDRDKFSKEQRDKDLAELLAMPQFRRYVWGLMYERCGLMQEPFNPNGSVQSYNAGMQAVAKMLWVEIESVNPKLIPQMMLEHQAMIEQEQK